MLREWEEFYVLLDPIERPDMTRDMTHQEKAALARAINKLNSANLDRVVKIIQENMPNVGNDDNPEIDIEINSMDKTTLWALQRTRGGIKRSRHHRRRRGLICAPQSAGRL